MKNISLEIIQTIKSVPNNIWILLLATITYIVYKKATFIEAVMMLVSSALFGPFLGNIINNLIIKLGWSVGSEGFAYSFAAVLSYNVLIQMIKQSPEISKNLFDKGRETLKIIKK